MKIFFAGVDSYIHKFKLGKDVRVLISYADFKNYYILKRWLQLYNIPHEYKEGEREVFLDSGAYGAMNSGKIIKLHEYIAFVERFRKVFSHIAALDVIGNAEKSMSNYKSMLRAGLDTVIPAWHHGEPLEYFDQYCKMTDYVALGGIARLSFSQTEYILGLIKKMAERKPKHVKLHVYGIMSVPIMRKVGHLVESVDSTTWMNAARFGSILMRAGHKLSFTKGSTDKLLREKLMEYNIRMFMRIEKDINAASNYVYGNQNILRND